MTYFDNRDRRDAAARLYGLLSDVRAAPRDARDYVLFERRDDLNALGVDDDHINAFDARDEAALDQHITQAGAVAMALRGDDGVTVTAQVGEPSPFGDGYTTLHPRTFDPQRSTGLSAQATRAMIDAVIASRRAVAPDGGGERVIVGVPDGAGGFSIVRPKVRTRSTATADTATVVLPADSAFLSHGHLEGANSFVDAPGENSGLGDASTLARQPPIPNFTVFDRRVGWHDLDNGRLRFTYPSGSMTRSQILELQRNLDAEQSLLHRKD